jgi:outer membrane protein assembly factor BamB
VSSGFSIPDVWPESLDLRWAVDVGDGYASPVVADGRVYQLSRQGVEEHVRCIELDSGKTVWQASYPAVGAVHAAAASHGIGPKSTPAIARNKLYTLGIGNTLSCFELETGRLLWRNTFEDRFAKPAPSCGASMSPLVDGKLCIVHVGHDRYGAMIALDADTGRPQWEYDGDGPGYGSPIIATLAGKRQIVTPVSKFVAGIDILNGKVLWREPFPTHSTQNVITPLQHRDLIITGGIGQPTVALRPDQGKVETEVERIWENKETSMHMSSPVLLEGKLFGLSRMKAGHLFCLDPETGETLWQGEGRLAKYAAILAVGKLLAILTSDGTLAFARPSATGLDYLAQYPVDPSGRAWAHPALVGTRILVKGNDNLTCWSLP